MARGLSRRPGNHEGALPTRPGAVAATPCRGLITIIVVMIVILVIVVVIVVIIIVMIIIHMMLIISRVLTCY